MPDLTGHSLGRYHILEQLGQGGMATVYKAYDTSLEREVAVKVIRREALPAEHHARIFKRFEREAMALAKLSHPHIVGVIEYGEHEGLPFLVMDYVSGGTLKQRLGRPIPWTEAIELVLPIARALDYAHARGIIHRDVKPSNILIAASGAPMLTDFGIAKVLEAGEGQTLSTTTGVGVGTPEYMAPEQGLGHEVDARADIYSLGIVLYELVTGRKPFRADTPMAVIVKHINDPLPRPKQFASAVPEAVEKVLFKALAKKAEDRYHSMAEFGSALDALLEPIRAREREIARRRAELARQAEARQRALAQKQAKRAQREEARKRARELVQGRLRGKKSLSIFSAIFLIVAVLSIVLIQNRGILGESALSASPANDPLSSSIQAVRTEYPLTNPQSVSTATLATQTTKTPTILPNPTLQVGSTWLRPSDGMTMVYVPAGEFTMGSNDGDEDERPIHEVYLDAYWIDRTEVTNAMYALCVADGDCKNPATSNRSSRYENHPVVSVNWEDARVYCAWAEARLPTEAEWEKAARGTDGRIYPWGNEKIPANYYVLSVDFPDTQPVGSYPSGASPYGALDMTGSAIEWVSDWYGDTYYSSSPDSNPQGPTRGVRHVLRGGTWGGGDRFLLTTARDGSDHTGSEFFSDYFVGFRCAGDAP